MIELGQKEKYVTPTYCDNQSNIKIAENPIFHARTKHIEVHHHFIQEKRLSRGLDLSHVSTNENLADILTKPLGRNKIEIIRFVLNLVVNRNSEP